MLSLPPRRFFPEQRDLLKFLDRARSVTPLVWPANRPEAQAPKHFYPQLTTFEPANLSEGPQKDNIFEPWNDQWGEAPNDEIEAGADAWLCIDRAGPPGETGEFCNSISESFDDLLD